MVYGFVKQSGGHVHVDSEPGRGTRVALYLPKSDLAEAAIADAPRIRGEEDGARWTTDEANMGEDTTGGG
jgi:hypothetical protein